MLKCVLYFLVQYLRYAETLHLPFTDSVSSTEHLNSAGNKHVIYYPIVPTQQINHNINFMARLLLS